MNKETNVVMLRTVQVAPIRTLFATLKELVTDLDIVITKEHMKITKYDKNHTVLVDVSIRMEEHECVHEKIRLCVHSLYMNNILSRVTNDDVFTMFIPESAYNDGHVKQFEVLFENKEFEQCTSYNMKLIIPENEAELVLPDTMNYDTIIVMPSTGFQKIIRALKAISTRVRIESIGDELIFTAIGEWCTASICRKEASIDSIFNNMMDTDDKKVRMTETIQFKKKPDPSIVFQGEFTLKSLNNIARLTPASTNVEIYMQNGLPLIVKYTVGSDLGYIRACLAPLTTNEI